MTINKLSTESSIENRSLKIIKSKKPSFKTKRWSLKFE
jgi:hypothetical protein